MKSAVRECVIDEATVDQRIDNFLHRTLNGVPRGYLYRILRTGQVRVNKRRVKPPYRLQVGDVVRIPPLYEAVKKTPRLLADRLLKTLESRILLEDDGVLIMNKPAGLAVHGGSGLSYGLIEAVRILRPKCQTLELVHRLDRSTSGCLVLAKKRSVLRQLHELLRENQMDKIYWALVQGRWPRKKIAIEAPLKKILRSGERLVQTHPQGKHAKTVFKMIHGSATASLVEAKLETGRTHQIRVHAQCSEHPIAGDDKYGDDEFNTKMQALGLRRLFLHAYEIAFQLPSGQRYDVKAPLESELNQVLEALVLI